MDHESAHMLIDIAVEKGMLCQLPKSTFYVLNDQAALEVSEDMGDFFEARFSRASPLERRRQIIECATSAYSVALGCASSCWGLAFLAHVAHF